MNMKFAYVGLLALTLASCGGKSSGLPEASNDYAVETVNTGNAKLNTSYPAMIKGQQDTEIRPKVSGFITRVFVKEGDVVKAGQVLFTIDSEQYRSAVQQAQGQIAQIKAQISTQELNVANRKMLNEHGVTSSFDLQSAQNNLAALRAQLAQANAALLNARTSLSYCTVTSPSNGVVGSIPYRVGSLVGPTNAEPLTSVSNISRAYVYFSITEKDALELSRNSGSLNAAIAQMPEVTLKLADGTEYELKGRISALSGVIDQNTGSLSMRADFDNPRRILRSGGTGNILIPAKATNTIVVPQAATYEIQDKKFVYVVGADKTVQPREITVLDQNDGTYYYVSGGLRQGERIVVEGVSTLKAGTKINPITPEQSAKNKEKAAKDLAEGKM